MKNEKKITLAEYIEGNCISTMKFCEKIGITHATLRKYLRGETKPSIDIAGAIQKATDGKVKVMDWLNWHDAN